MSLQSVPRSKMFCVIKCVSAFQPSGWAFGPPSSDGPVLHIQDRFHQTFQILITRKIYCLVQEKLTAIKIIQFLYTFA